DSEAGDTLSPEEDAQRYECFDSDALLGATIKVGVAANQSKYQSFAVPPMSSDPLVYSYALEQAFVVLPTRCIRELGLQPNVGDSDKLIDLWMGRMADLSQASLARTPEARDAVLKHCACGWAIFLHGSGGFNYDNPRYSIMMATAGYGVLAPDSFASSTLGLRYKAPIKDLASHLHKLNSNGSTLSYWCSDYVYEPSAACTPAMEVSTPGTTSYPLCYDSNVETILSHAKDWRKYYERVFQLRKLQVDYLVEHLPSYIKGASKVFLAGESEGGMVAARYYHPKLEPLLESGGRVILQWNCEFCYYVSCPKNALVGSGKANLSTPVLSLISYVDPFFGAQGPEEASNAWGVANGPGGYGVTGASATGNCFAQLQAQGFKHAYVLTDFSSQYHGLTVTSGNLVRATLLSFLATPRSPKVMTKLGNGPEGAKLCDLQFAGPQGGQVLGSCKELGSEELIPGDLMPKCAYKSYNYHKQFYLLGEFEECARL
ncbi:unnamed protein product, partial [Polarella glacialis]